MTVMPQQTVRDYNRRPIHEQVPTAYLVRDTLDDTVRASFSRLEDAAGFVSRNFRVYLADPIRPTRPER